MTEGRRIVRVRVAGRVQGVSYRAWTCREARRLQLTGWVRNRLDGTVEALFVGAAEDVAAMIEACRRGPRLAWVESVAVDEAAEHEAGHHGFAQRETL
jgi:acylphosphatase